MLWLDVAYKTALQLRRDPLSLGLTLGTTPFFVGFYRLLFSGEDADPTFQSYVPGLLVFSVIMLVFSSSMTVAREVERGTLERLRLTQLRSEELLLGVSAVQAVLGVASLGLTLLVALALGFEPSPGSLGLAMLTGALAGLSCVGLGTLVSSVTSSVQRAFLISSFLMFLLMLFSGVVFPIPKTQPLPGTGLRLLDLLPTTHAVTALGDVLLRDATFRDVQHRLLAMIALGAGFFGAGALAFARRHRTYLV